jgi:hypothetical protein
MPDRARRLNQNAKLAARGDGETPALTTLDHPSLTPADNLRGFRQRTLADLKKKWSRVGDFADPSGWIEKGRRQVLTQRRRYRPLALTSQGQIPSRHIPTRSRGIAMLPHERKTRVSRAPQIERLEGRRLPSAIPAVPIVARVREVSVPGGVQLRIIGTNRPDTIIINDNGTGQAGNIQVTVNGRNYTSKYADSSIYVVGNQGNDVVTYNLTGNLIAARTVVAQLGGGDDQFTANIPHDIQTTKLFDLEADGNGGNNTLTINQTGNAMAGTFFPYLNGGGKNDTITYNMQGDIGATAVVGPALLGGTGTNTINLNYSGNVMGQLFYSSTINGGTGNNTINAQVHLGPLSTGKVGTSPTTPAVVTGGSGNNMITFAVRVDPLAATTTQVFAQAVGGTGSNTVLRTSNVLGDPSNKNDAIIS